MVDVKALEKLITKELQDANEIHPLFHSAHEAFAVLMEEAQELNEEVKRINSLMECMWKDVRADAAVGANMDAIYEAAIDAICEAIQVAAMCKKARWSKIV